MGHRHVASNSVVEEADDSPFSLFELDGAGWHIPVNELMAIAMEVEALLSDRRCDQDPRPERAVERLADDLGMDSGVLVRPGTAERHREPRRQAAARDSAARVRLIRGDRERLEVGCCCECLGDLGRHVGRASTWSCLLVDQQVDVFVHDSLQRSLDAVVEGVAPVRG